MEGLKVATALTIYILLSFGFTAAAVEDIGAPAPSPTNNGECWDSIVCSGNLGCYQYL